MSLLVGWAVFLAGFVFGFFVAALLAANGRDPE